MEYVQVRHEEMAAFMASAHAKFTGGVGLCYATSGPGAIHLLNGLYDAKMDNQPVVAIVGQQARTALGARYQQEVDLVALFKDVASDYVAIGTVPSQVRHMVDRAVRIAQTKRSVTCIILPNDLQLMDYEDPPVAHGATHTGVGFPAESKVPESQGLRDAAKVLNEGKKVAMLVGAGCLEGDRRSARGRGQTQRGRRQGAARQGRPSRRSAFRHGRPRPSRHQAVLGADEELRHAADGRLVLSRTASFCRTPASARGVQIDIKGENLSLRYPMEVNLLGDSAATLRALLPLLEQKSDTKWRDRSRTIVPDWWKVLESARHERRRPDQPAARLLGAVAAPAGPLHRHRRQRLGRQLVRARPEIPPRHEGLAVRFARLARGRDPYALAAKMAYPERPVIGTIGDGAMQMNGMNVMITVSKYWKQWSNPVFIMMVLNNRDLNQVTWEERVQLGDGKTESTQSIPDLPYAKYAELLGLKGIFCKDPDNIGAAWDEALAADRPVILEFYTDPNVPPLPPHITLKDATHFMTMMPDEPELGSVLKNSAKELVSTILPGR